MLNIEGISSEAKVGKILVLVSLVLGILVLIFLGVLGGVIYSAGKFEALSVNLDIPLAFLVAILFLKGIGLVVGFFALHATEKRDFNRAGIFAIISSVLPPLDLIMLIGGIFCLVSREANEEKKKEGERTPPL
ncbi:MAG: hypothetical protein NQU46_00800 [Methanolinea sp.]|nr:hypothetical protein [Methanolinea sp.]